MKQLKELDIRDTDIDQDLEYLPESVEYFNCSAKERKDAKCQNIYNLFADEQGEVETGKYGSIKNFSQKLQEYKQKTPQEKARFLLRKELQAKDQRITGLEKELQIKRDASQTSVELMDNFYRQNPPREDLALKNILSETSDDCLETSRENQQSKEQVSPQPKTIQEKFKHFLKSYLTEKQAQISHEQDQSKLEFLQEELKILKQLQEKQEQKQIQQIQWELKEILIAYLNEKQEQLTETLVILHSDYPDNVMVDLSGREEVKSIQEEINILQAELAKQEEINQKQQQEPEQEKQQSLQHQVAEIVELEEQTAQILHLGIPGSSRNN